MDGIWSFLLQPVLELYIFYKILKHLLSNFEWWIQEDLLIEKLPLGAIVSLVNRVKPFRVILAEKSDGLNSDVFECLAMTQVYKSIRFFRKNDPKWLYPIYQ